MTDQKPSAALVKREQGTVLTTPTEFSAFLAQKRSEHCHILSPATDIGSLPDGWVIVPSAVYLSPNEADGDVYKDGLFCRGDEVAPTKVGLRKIAKAAGISWAVTREDSGNVPYYWAMKCTISFRGHDGLTKSEEASYEWDLRDGSPRVGGMSPKELNRARLNGYRRCEAGAINAAIREYGLRQKYTKQELQKPFVCFNLVFQAETPEQKTMLAQAVFGTTNMLYGSPALPEANHAKGTIIDVESGEITEGTTVKAGPAQPANAVPFDEEPASTAKDPEPTFHISGVFASGGRWFFKTEETGEQVIWTDDKSAAQAANVARKTRTAVVIETEQRGADTWLVGFSEAVKL